MKVAIARPFWARNQTAFEVQADLYARIQREHPDVEAHIFADPEFEYQHPELRVVPTPRWEDRLRLGGILRSMGWPTYHYASLLQQLSSYDVIETSDPTQYVYAHYAALAARLHGARLVFGGSEIDPNRVTSPRSYMMRAARWVSQNTAAIFCPTRLQAQRFQELGLTSHEHSRVWVDMYAVDINKFYPPKTTSDETNIKILSVGRFHRDKGHHVLLQAFAQLCRQYNHLQLDIVGTSDTFEQELYMLADELQINESVTFRTNVPYHQMPNVYREADIFTLNSLTSPLGEERFGAVLIEAMASGLPVLASNCGAMPQVLPDKHQDWIVPQQDIKALCQKLKQLIISSERRQQIGREARQHVCQKYSQARVAKRWLQAWRGEKGA